MTQAAESSAKLERWLALVVVHRQRRIGQRVGNGQRRCGNCRAGYAAQFRS
jgi:hypothetical protein